MGRVAGLINRGGSIAAALFVAAIVVTCGAQAAHAGPAANVAQQNFFSVTAGAAEKDGTMPQAPWPDANVKYVDPGMPTPEPWQAARSRSNQADKSSPSTPSTRISWRRVRPASVPSYRW